jgi:hypothetical protein
MVIVGLFVFFTQPGITADITERPINSKVEANFFMAFIYTYKEGILFAHTINEISVITRMV